METHTEKEIVRFVGDIGCNDKIWRIVQSCALNDYDVFSRFFGALSNIAMRDKAAAFTTPLARAAAIVEAIQAVSDVSNPFSLVEQVQGAL